MKSQIINHLEPEVEKPRTYPYIGISKDLTVLFFKKNCGTILTQDDSEGVGRYDRDWEEKCFEVLPAHKSIILSN